MSRNDKGKKPTSEVRLFRPPVLNFGKWKGFQLNEVEDSYLWWIQRKFDKEDMWFIKSNDELVRRGLAPKKRKRRIKYMTKTR